MPDGNEGMLRREFRLRRLEQQFNEARIRALELKVHLLDRSESESDDESVDQNMEDNNDSK